MNHAAKIIIISHTTKLSPFFSSAINNHSSTTYHLPFAQPRPRRINTRTSCVKQSQLSCQREQSIKLA